MSEQTQTVKSLRCISSIKGLKLKRNIRINRTHIVLDVYECDDKALAKVKILEQRVKRIFQQFSLEPTIQTFYQFKPFGVTAIVYAPGVQFTVHTWPEYKSAAIDLYVFTDRKQAMNLCEELKTLFKSAEYEMRVRQR